MSLFLLKSSHTIRTYLCRAKCAIAVGLIGTSLHANAQAPAPEPSFEVATIKPVDATQHFNPRHYWAHVTPAGASYWSMTVRYLVAYAYDVESFQVTGPESTTADRFDIEARFPDGADKKDDRKMLQTLLKDRFKLTFHVEKRELETYALLVGKHGEKLKPSLPDPVPPATDPPVKAGESNIAAEPAKPKVVTTQDGTSKVDQGKRGTFSVKLDRENWSNHFEYSKMTMEDLAKILSSCLGSGVHKVVDETGIKGNYQTAFDCPLPGRPPSSGGDAASDPQDTSLLPRSLDALGLRLEKRKVLMDVYVIDQVEKPSEN